MIAPPEAVPPPPTPPPPPPPQPTENEEAQPQQFSVVVENPGSSLPLELRDIEASGSLVAENTDNSQVGNPLYGRQSSAFWSKLNNHVACYNCR